MNNEKALKELADLLAVQETVELYFEMLSGKVYGYLFGLDCPEYEAHTESYRAIHEMVAGWSTEIDRMVRRSILVNLDSDEAELLIALVKINTLPHDVNLVTVANAVRRAGVDVDAERVADLQVKAMDSERVVYQKIQAMIKTLGEGGNG